MSTPAAAHARCCTPFLAGLQVTQAVAQVDAAQKITVQANGASDFSNTDMARVRCLHTVVLPDAVCSCCRR